MEQLTLEELMYYWQDKAEEYFEKGEKYSFMEAYDTYRFYYDQYNFCLREGAIEWDRRISELNGEDA